MCLVDFGPMAGKERTIAPRPALHIRRIPLGPIGALATEVPCLRPSLAFVKCSCAGDFQGIKLPGQKSSIAGFRRW